MAGEIGLSNVGETAVNAGATIWTILLWVILIAVVVGLIWFIFWFRSYSKKKIVLYEKLSNGWQQKMYSAKEFRDRDGGLRWKIWRLWRKTPRPPSESIIMDDRKRLLAYGFIVDDNIVWAKTALNFTKDKARDIDFDPLLAEDKNMYINEVKEAEKYRRKRVLDYLAQAAPIIGIVIILVVFMAFFGEVVKPMQVTGDNIIKYDEQRHEEFMSAMDKLDVIINNKVQLQSSTTDSVVDPKAKPPN